MSALNASPPKVYLIGAGPGHPCLLTKKAERCLQKADVILYDQLVHPFLLHLSSPETEWIHVGKTPYTKYIKQERINQLIVEKAQTAQTIVRLKGGDPAIFGRVAEEVETLRAHHIDYEIVPGITAASAAVSQLGKGLTERNVSTNITFTTGHFKNNEENEIDMTTLEHGGTLAIYMGIKRLPRLMHYIKNKMGIDFPVAIVFNATHPNQRVISGTVNTIVEQIEMLPERLGPGVTIVGQVVRDVQTDVANTSRNYETVLIRGERLEAIARAFDYFEAGHQVVIDDRHYSDLHASQIEKITQLIQDTTFTQVVDL